MQKDTHEEKFDLISQWYKKLGDIKDVDILLENILLASKDILNADAGSIYDFDEEKQELCIKYTVNDTIQKRLAPGEKLPYVSFTFPAAKTMGGYCALNKCNINIADVYNMSEEEKSKFVFNQESDLKTNYHTQSMLVIPLIMRNGKVHGVIQLINAKDKEDNVIPFDKDSEFYILNFTSQLGRIYDYAYQTKQFIERLCKASSYRDPLETGAHVARVSTFSVEIYDKWALNNNIPEKERVRYRDNLKLASKCHDVGKIGVQDAILKKPGILDDAERNIMKGHTCVGAQIFTPVENELDIMSRDICLHHHDRWDGDTRGYPGKYEDYMAYVPGTPVPQIQQPLMGKDIPLAARIVAIADVYDALSHKRCYKEAWTSDRVFETMMAEKGKQFDPELIDIFQQIWDRLETINSNLSR